MKNRRAAAVAFLTAVLIILQFFPAQAAEVQELYALSAVLMDGETGRVLYGKEAYKARPNESTTKDMTSIIAIMDTVKEIDITYDAVADNKNVYLNDLREDFSVPSFPTEKILQNAVNDENCFVVPKVVE